MINEEALRSYLMEYYSGATSFAIRKIGSGVQGSGFLVELESPEGPRSYVVKRLFDSGLGHDFPSDRAGVFLLDLQDFGTLPNHIKAIEVLSEMPDGSIRGIGGGVEYYLLMEKASGTDYFHDLRAFREKKHLTEADAKKISSMASYLASIHSVKRASRELYWRKLRDIVGHGECLMGVFDTYPEGTMSYEDMAEIEKLCVGWRARLKTKTGRLCQVHGDFHPGNIWFREKNNHSQESGRDYAAGPDFILLDRSRGAWGEPADDVTALSINYIFFSLMQFGDVRGIFREGLELFINEYIRRSDDNELFYVMAPFFAFRAAVVANPLFYPDVSPEIRRKIWLFSKNLLLSPAFELHRVNTYIG